MTLEDEDQCKGGAVSLEREAQERGEPRSSSAAAALIRKDGGELDKIDESNEIDKNEIVLIESNEEEEEDEHKVRIIVNQGEKKEEQEAEDEKLKENDKNNEKSKKRFPLSFFIKPNIFGGRRSKEEKQSKLASGSELVDNVQPISTSQIKENSKIEIEKGFEEKQEKNSDTDVTLTVTDEKDETGEISHASAATTGGGGVIDSLPTAKLFSGRFTSQKWKWFFSGFVLCFVIFLLTGFLVAKLTYFPPDTFEEIDENQSPLAVTSCGPVWGQKDLDGIFTFKGIPYALPPLQDLRWKSPVSLSEIKDCWSGTLKALNESSYCFQKPIPDYPNISFSEDCLYLNIISPSLSYANPRPVVVFLGGSSLQGLDNLDLEWQPEPWLAKEKNVIFVTFNYRMNIFGFLALDELAQQVHPPVSGNYGIQDQLAALRWINKNIRHFGGDPEKVTLLARGSGATSALTLLSSTREAKGLFQKVWMTGGTAIFAEKNIKDVYEQNKEILTNLKCKTAECLYSKSAEDLISWIPDWWAEQTVMDLPDPLEKHDPEVIVVDGTILYDNPSNIWKDRNINNVTIVIGATAQESSSFESSPDATDWDWTEFSNYVTQRLNDVSANSSTADILEFYIDNATRPHFQLHKMISDLRVICPLQELSLHLSGISVEPVYFYLSEHLPSSKLSYTANEAEKISMSSHGIDIISIFGILDRFLPSMTSRDKEFQDNIQKIFYDFVFDKSPAILKTAKNQINFISDNVYSSEAPYKNCRVWSQQDISRFARIN